MSSIDTENQTIYKVVVNHEEQYSIWPATSMVRPVNCSYKTYTAGIIFLGRDFGRPFTS
ncbi:MbtH family NRPS accessory protein [aff. Roholtiella sp. LEGE 12411]|nr:MbtH family NRPS accessory protein [aff. Roholtiella sp. LEGE 12411]